MEEEEDEGRAGGSQQGGEEIFVERWVVIPSSIEREGEREERLEASENQNKLIESFNGEPYRRTKIGKMVAGMVAGKRRRREKMRENMQEKQYVEKEN